MDIEEQQRSTTSSLTLVMGGVRSGKSRFAQDLASSLGNGDVLFVATAEAGDGEMSDRIKRHRQSRPSAWETLECSLNVGDHLLSTGELPNVVLIDCLTLLVSNVMFEHEDAGTDIERLVLDEVDAIIQVAKERSTHVLIVSGEVGMGVVPESAMGRQFRDLLGFANQRFAAASQATYLMVAGLAIDVKRLATSVADASTNALHTA